MFQKQFFCHFSFQFFYELKAKGSPIFEKCASGFHFLFHLGFTKVYFYFEGVSKNYESVKKVKKYFNQDSFHASLNSHYKASRYKKKIKAQKFKASKKEYSLIRCLLILNLKPFRSYVKGKYSISRESQNLALQGKKLLIQTSL